MKADFERLNKCPYCKSEENKHKMILVTTDLLNKLPGIFQLKKCSECGLVFQNPRVCEKDIHLYYPETMGYYNPVKIKSKRYKIFLKNFLLKYSKRFRRIRLYPDFLNNLKEAKLLEIGCAHGQRLEELYNVGWKNSIGIEIDRRSFEYAMNIRKMNVINTRIEDFNIEKEEYDVIILSMVLEHLYDPFKSLIKITNGLKPGGQLIFSIPYFEGVEYRLFKTYSYGIQLPTHMTFFNKKILNEFLSSIGYKDIKFYFQSFERDITASAMNRYDATGSILYKVIGSNKIIKKLLIKPILFLLSLLGKTGRVTVYAKRKEVHI